MRKTPENAHLGYSDTPVLPDSGYHVHDGERPQPPVVTPGPTARDAPSDAEILFDGSSLGGWVSATDGGPARWRLTGDGAMEVEPGAGDIRTVEKLGSRIQLHVEFAAPGRIEKQGQGRGNSGIFLAGLYEIQVLDNYDNPTYADGTVGAIYGQWPPLANPIRRPGEWNTVGIIWEGPVFENKALVRPARATVMINGVVAHHAKELHGPTRHRELARYEPHDAEMPLLLQDHGDPVRFRNIWYRDIGDYDGDYDS